MILPIVKCGVAMGDRFSNLPDEILLHIFSFLPTEDFFATSLVCKRTIPLWLSLPTLDFDEKRCMRPASRSLLQLPSSFLQFIYESILRRGIHQPIKTLRLKGKAPTFSGHVETWLNAAAVRRNVENLDMDSYTGKRLILPCSIFSITTLVVLKLYCMSFKDFSTVELPSLQALHLNYVNFVKPQHLMELLNGCPKLGKLEAKNINFDFDDPSFKGKVQTLSKLVRAQLSIGRVKHMSVFCIDEFLREMCGADIPVFPNLIHMELIVRFEVKMESVIYLLNHCPQLQTFVLENILCAAKQVWPNTPVVPKCFSSQLRTCVITVFAGRECEMRFAKFVMQNSTLLTTMSISSFRFLSYEEKAEMRIELDSCPRSSATCQLLFI